MRTNFFFRRSNLVFVLIFFIAVLTLTSGYIFRSDQQDREQFSNHAKIITADIWALNDIGVKTYLQLAVKANHYKHLKVAIPGDKNFVKVISTELNGIESNLYKAGFIWVKPLKKDIVYDETVIGTLSGEKYVRVIYPALNIVLILLLILLTAFIISYLSSSRNMLEKEVQERTKNLQQSEKRFHDLVNLLPEIVLETDLDGTILYANQAAEDKLGLSHITKPNATILDYLPARERPKLLNEVLQSLQGGPSTLKEYSLLDRVGNTYPALLRSAPIFQGSRLIGARMIAIDISERRKLKEELHRDQKMKAIGLMAGGVAHDLNNILSGIISYPEYILLDLEPDNKHRHPLEMIRQSGLEAAEVVADLLTVARGVSANTEVTNLNSLIRGYLATPDFKKLKKIYPKISLTTEFDPSLSNVSCSPIHVRKCLMNLIQNGMEAIATGGHLRIETRNYFQTDTELMSEPEKEPPTPFSVVSVSDSGSGIPADEIDRIFEPFYTKKVLGRSGTGLGLAVVWNTMRDHKGKVEVTSKESGTTFELFFPSVSEPIPTKLDDQNWQMFKGNGQTILVIDDDLRQLDIAEKLLTAFSYAVIKVSSGEEAVQYLQDNSVDLILLDMIMEPGLNGKETYEQILEIHPRQKAIIVSGYAESDDVKATLKLGAESIVSKPYSMEHLGAAIYKVLHPN